MENKNAKQHVQDVSEGLQNALDSVEKLSY